MSGPLRAVAFERYMLSDDRPSHPMAFSIRLKFSGTPDVDALRVAARQAAERHPLLVSNIRFRSVDDFDWIPAADPAPYLDIAPAGTKLRFPGAEQFDLRRETALRIWVRYGDDRTEIRFQFQHAATDGLGAYRFIEDFLAAYEAAYIGSGAQPRWNPVDASRLTQRDKFGLNRWQMLLRLPVELWGIVVGMIMFFIPKPKPLAKPVQPVVTADAALELIDPPAFTFAGSDFAKLRAAAKNLGVTLNDLMLRDTFLAMDRWNKRHAPATAGKLLRIMIPFSLRSPDDEIMPATNIVAMVNLDRMLAVYRNPKWLLKTIRWEMNFLKHFRFAIAFVRCCELIGKIPGGLRYLANPNRCFATAVFSNLGKLFYNCPLVRTDGKLVAGNLSLDHVESAPPVRPYTAAGITSLSYNGALTVVMNYDRYHFTPETAGEFMEMMADQFRETAGIPTSASVSTPSQTPAYAA